MSGREEEPLGESGRAITDLGRIVRQWRQRRGLSVTALAVRAGFGVAGRSYISKIEHGYIQRVGPKRRRAIVKALRIAARDLPGALTAPKRPALVARGARTDGPEAPQRSATAPSERNSTDRERVGSLIRRFRLARPRLGATGRRDYPFMTKAEFATEYSREEARLTGQPRKRGESYISKLERGALRLTLPRLEVIARALRLDPWERALLQEIAGYRGLLAYLAEQLGVRVLEVGTLIERVLQRDMTFRDVQHEVTDWARTTQDELRHQAAAQG